MSTTLSYGYKIPASGESGTAVFTILEDDITRLNSHSHNGTDSALLSRTAIVGTSQTISSSSWSANGATGHYRQAVTLPAGFSYDTVTISFRTTAGDVIIPTVEKISATQYYVYTIDSTINFIALYGG